MAPVYDLAHLEQVRLAEPKDDPPRSYPKAMEPVKGTLQGLHVALAPDGQAIKRRLHPVCIVSAEPPKLSLSLELEDDAPDHCCLCRSAISPRV